MQPQDPSGEEPSSDPSPEGSPSPAPAEGLPAGAPTEEAPLAGETPEPPVTAPEPLLVGTPVAEAGEAPKDPPKGFVERVQGVLFLPGWAFSHHEGAWGWAKPWLLVAAIGIVVGAVTLLRVDLGAVIQHQSDLAMDQMPAKQRRLIDANPQAKAMTEKAVKMQVFFAKVSTILGPPIMGLIGILVAGGGLFVLTRFVRGPDTPTDLLRCISLAAYVSLVNGLRYAAVGVGVLTGNAMATTSPAGLVSPATQPLIYTALERLDPFVIFYYVVLAAGLAGSLRLPRKKAIGLAAGLYAAFSLLAIGLAGLGQAAQGLGSMGAG